MLREEVAKERKAKEAEQADLLSVMGSGDVSALNDPGFRERVQRCMQAQIEEANIGRMFKALQNSELEPPND